MAEEIRSSVPSRVEMRSVTETVPIAVTGIVGIVLLVLVKGVPGVEEALYGFGQPVSYFLVGILTLGLPSPRPNWP